MTNHTPEPWPEPKNKSHPTWRIAGCSDGCHSEGILNYADYLRARACVNACEGMEDPEKEIAALRADNQMLVDALEEAIEGMEDMIGYVPDYFREKWKHDDCIKEAREALASVREKEEG